MRRAPFFKRSLSRDLLLGIAMSVFVFVCAFAWGGPFLSTASYETQHATFAGTVARDGAQLVLRDDTGRVYSLDDPQQAQPFEGKAVTVTGTLDPGAHVLHVDQIEVDQIEPARG